MFPWSRAPNAPPDFRLKAGKSAFPAAAGLESRRSVPSGSAARESGPTLRGEMRLSAGTGHFFSIAAKGRAAKSPQTGGMAAVLGCSAPSFDVFPGLFASWTAPAGFPHPAVGLPTTHQSGEQVTNLVNHRFGERLTGSVSPTLVRPRVASQAPSFAFASVFQPFHPESARASRSAPAGFSLERISR